MRVILEPTVTTFSKQIFIEHPVYKIPADGNDAVKIGAFAAKGCYDSFGENGRANEENQRQVIEHVHGSVLEHIQVGVFIEGVTRGLSLESNRHRQNAISQRSTRYTAEEDAAIVLEPYYAELWRKYVTLAQITRVPATDTHPVAHVYISFHDFTHIIVTRLIVKHNGHLLFWQAKRFYFVK